MVEQEAVNFEVAGSSPASRAKRNESCIYVRLFSFYTVRVGENRRFDIPPSEA